MLSCLGMQQLRQQQARLAANHMVQVQVRRAECESVIAWLPPQLTTRGQHGSRSAHTCVMIFGITGGGVQANCGFNTDVASQTQYGQHFLCSALCGKASLMPCWRQMQGAHECISISAQEVVFLLIRSINFRCGDEASQMPACPRLALQALPVHATSDAWAGGWHLSLCGVTSGVSGIRISEGIMDTDCRFVRCAP